LPTVIGTSGEAHSRSEAGVSVIVCVVAVAASVAKEIRKRNDRTVSCFLLLRHYIYKRVTILTGFWDNIIIILYCSSVQ
jgi:hypothetical protein